MYPVLKTDLTLLLTGFGHVSHFTAYVTLDGGTSVTPMPYLLATKPVVFGTAFCVVIVDLVAFEFRVSTVDDHSNWIGAWNGNVRMDDSDED